MSVVIDYVEETWRYMEIKCGYCGDSAGFSGIRTVRMTVH